MKKLLPILFFVFASFAFADGYVIQQSATAQPLIFLMIDSADHIAAKTGLTTTVTLSKNGGTFAAPSGAVTEIANGWYKVAGNATDSNTLGPLVLHATASGADPTDIVYNVVAYNPQDAVRLGLTALPNVVSGSAGAIPTTGTGANQISVASGAVTVGTNGDKTNYSLSGTQTFNLTGNVSGSVGSVTARVTANTDQFNGQAITAAAPVTIPTSIASPTNITAGTITTVSNLTNAPTAGDLTAAMKTSVTTAATAATPTIASVSGSVGSVAGNVVGSVGSLGATAKTDVTTAATAATPTVTVGSVTSVGTCNALGATAKTDVTTAATAATPICSALGTTAKSDVTTAATAATPTAAGVSGTVNANVVQFNGRAFLGNGATGNPIH